MPKISELTDQPSPSSSDYIPVVSGGETKRANLSTLPIPTAVQTALDAKQPLDATLTAVAGVAAAADKVPYFTGVDTADVTSLTAFGRSLIDDANAGAALTTLGVSTFAKTILDDTSEATARATLGMTATVVDRSYAEYTTNANMTTIIPADDTIPQNTEGTQILSVSHTPKKTTNRLRLRFQGQVSASTNITVIVALFSSASANALRAVTATVTTANYSLQTALEYEYVPGTTSPLTFSVRVGPSSAATVALNGNTTGRLVGGAAGATLVVEEIE